MASQSALLYFLPGRKELFSLTTAYAGDLEPQGIIFWYAKDSRDQKENQKTFDYEAKASTGLPHNPGKENLERKCSQQNMVGLCEDKGNLRNRSAWRLRLETKIYARPVTKRSDEEITPQLFLSFGNTISGYSSRMILQNRVKFIFNSKCNQL